MILIVTKVASRSTPLRRMPRQPLLVGVDTGRVDVAVAELDGVTN